MRQWPLLNLTRARWRERAEHSIADCQFPIADWKLPLPLGEGWGEGLAKETRRVLSSFFQGPAALSEETKSRWCAAKPSPRPSPKGRGRFGNGKDWIHRVHARPSGFASRGGPRIRLARVSQPPARAALARAGGALYGLRRSVLPYRDDC